MKTLLLKDFYNELHNGIVVEITEKYVEKFDGTDFDPKMRGRIEKVLAPDMHGVVKIFFNIKEFSEYNKQFEQPAFRDNSGDPCLKWSETEYYPKDGIVVDYLMEDDNFYELFNIVETEEDFIKIVPTVFVARSDDWEGFYINGKLIDEEHELGGADRLFWLLQISEKYGFSSQDVKTHYFENDPVSEFLEDMGGFPPTIEDLIEVMGNDDFFEVI